ncbi:hypothetical protein SANTM175S_08426 [Streptomyces antimycoticus]
MRHARPRIPVHVLRGPATIAFINKTTGTPNLAALLVYAIIVAFSASARVTLAYWLHPLDRARSAARRWTVTYTILIVALSALFVAGEAPIERRVDFDTYYSSTAFIREFILLYLVALAVADVALMGLCWKWAGLAGRPWLRRAWDSPLARVVALPSALPNS